MTTTPQLLRADKIFDNLCNKGIFREIQFWLSYKEFMVDDLVTIGDEGRGKQRYAPASSKQALTRRSPNGATHLE